MEIKSAFAFNNYLTIMLFALFLVVKTPASSTSVLSAMQTKNTKTSLADSLSKPSLCLCSCPGNSCLETGRGKETVAL